MNKETFEKAAKISEDMKSLWLIIKKYRAVPLYRLLMKEAMKSHLQVSKKMQSKIFFLNMKRK